MANRRARSVGNTAHEVVLLVVGGLAVAITPLGPPARWCRWSWVGRLRLAGQVLDRNQIGEESEVAGVVGDDGRRAVGEGAGDDVGIVHLFAGPAATSSISRKVVAAPSPRSLAIERISSALSSASLGVMPRPLASSGLVMTARYSRMICGVTARYRSSVVRNATACPRWSRLRSVAASSTLVSTTTRGGGSALIVTVELGAIKRCSAPRGDRPKAQQAGRCFGDRLGGDPREGVAKLLLRGVPPSRRAPPEGRDRLVRHIPDVKCLHHPMLAQALASGCPRIEQPPKWEHTSTGEAT